MRPVSSRVLLAVALVGLFVAAPLLVAPSAEAQIWLGADRGEATFGWTFPEDGDYPGMALDDASGDVQADTDAAAAPVAAEARPELDILGFRIDEPDRETLRMVLEVGALDPQRFAATLFLASTRYTIEFDVGGTDYLIQSYLTSGCTDKTVPGLCEPYTDPQMVWEARLYESRPQDLRPVGYLPTLVVPEEGRLEALIPRWALDGPGSASAPVAGDLIRDVSVLSRSLRFCVTSSAGCGTIYDALPDEGAAPDVHAIVLDSNGARVRFDDGRGPARPDEDGDVYLIPLRPRVLHMDVSPGDIAQVPVRVLNERPGKALVLADAEVLSTHSVPVHVAESLEVPGGEHRKLLVTINGTDAISPEDPLEVRLALETIGPKPAYDVLTLVIRSVPVLSETQPRLYLHTYGEDYGGIVGLLGLEYPWTVLNTLADDPADTENGVVMNDFCFCINRPYGWYAQTGLPSTIDLDNASTSTLHLRVDAPVPGTLMLDPVFSYGEQVVAVGSAEIELAQGSNDIEVPLYIDEEAATLEPGDAAFSMELRPIFRPGGVLFGEFAALAEPVNPTLQTGGASWIELPIIDPAERFADATHVALDLGQGTDRVQYMNPGRSALWHVTIINQADTTDTLAVAADTPEGWQATIEPGKRYELGPGESVTVGVRATAPTDASEGATAKIVVQVESALAEGATAGTTLSAVVTKGVAIDEPDYAPDNETSARLAEKTTTEESPAAFASVPVALLVALVLHRRRRS